MAAIARGLGLDEEALVTPARGRNATLRLLHYAPAPPDFVFHGYDENEPEAVGDGRRLIARSHVDTGLLSFLWQNTTGGLQMEGPDGIWREVPQAPDGLSVHCGDLVEALTGGRLEGTVHRVVGHGEGRCSVGFFLEPDFETEVVAPKGGAPVSYARHLVNEFPDRFEAPKGGMKQVRRLNPSPRPIPHESAMAKGSVPAVAEGTLERAMVGIVSDRKSHSFLFSGLRDIPHKREHTDSSGLLDRSKLGSGMAWNDPGHNLRDTSSPQPARAPSTTTSQGGTFQDASNASAARARAKSIPERTPAVHTGS